MHCGEAIERDGDWFGANVATAARIAAEADGGESLVSGAVRELVDHEVALTEVRTTELKGLPGTHTLWRVDRDRSSGHSPDR